MPIFQYQNYTNPYGPSIAEALQHQGDIQAAGALRAGDLEGEAARQQGAIERQMWGGLGQGIAAIPAQQQAAQELALRQNQLRLQNQQLASAAQDKQRTRDAESAFAQALGQTPLLDDGTYDVPGIAKAMDPRFGADAVPLFQHIENVNTAVLGHAKTQEQQTQQAAASLIAAGSSPILTDNFLVTTAKRGRLTPDQLTQYRQQVQDDPSQAESILRLFAGPQKGEAVPKDTVIVDPLTKKPLFSNVQPDKPKFEQAPTVKGPNGEPLAFDAGVGQYRNVATSAIVPNPVGAEKPPTAEEDKARYIKLQADAAQGIPLTPAALAWVKAYEKATTLTVDTSAAAAAGRQADAIKQQTAQQGRAQSFAEQQVGRKELTDKVEAPFLTAQNSAQELRDVVAAAQAGNKVAGSLQNLQATMTTIRSQGLSRINQTEIGTTAGAGNLWDHLNSWMGKATAGQPVPPDIQADMIKYADILERAAYDKYTTGHKAVTGRYGLTDEKPLAPPQSVAPPPPAPAPGATRFSVGDVVTVRGQPIRITALHPDGTFDGDPVR
jgi:hypothetical protein